MRLKSTHNLFPGVFHNVSVTAMIDGLMPKMQELAVVMYNGPKEKRSEGILELIQEMREEFRQKLRIIDPLDKKTAQDLHKMIKKGGNLSDLPLEKSQVQRIYELQELIIRDGSPEIVYYALGAEEKTGLTEQQYKKLLNL